MKLFIVLWRANALYKWASDGIFEDRRIAEAKYNLETLLHPGWLHVIVEAELPEVTE